MPTCERLAAVAGGDPPLGSCGARLGEHSTHSQDTGVPLCFERATQ